MADPTPLAELPKSVARQAALERREEAHRLAGADHGRLIADMFLEAVPVSRGAVVGGYYPIRSEADGLPLLAALAAKGHVCALPHVVSEGAALEFGEWIPGSATRDGPFGTRLPPPHARLVVPDLLLVPLIAFDRHGFRLGYGGGFYDRTLGSLRRSHKFVAVGIGFALQEWESVPRQSHDEPLDWVVTERAAIRFERNGV